jgi:hypothetical protein
MKISTQWFHNWISKGTQKRESKDREKRFWHRWFAWYPVEVKDHEWRWLEPVARRLDFRILGACYVYRDLYDLNGDPGFKPQSEQEGGKRMFDTEKILGLSISAVKGLRTDRRKKQNISPRYILLSDGETFIHLEEQDYYTYHDCSYTARELYVSQDEKSWSRIMEDDDLYPHANDSLY